MDFLDVVVTQVGGDESPLEHIFIGTVAHPKRIENLDGDVLLVRAVVCGRGARVNKFTSARQYHILRHVQNRRSQVPHEDDLFSR